MPDPMIETELKLAGPPDLVRRLARQRLLRGGAPPVVRRLYSIYFDTPARDLWQRGITLRVRRERLTAGQDARSGSAGVRWVQTVKGGGAARGGLTERLELESEVAGPMPELGRIPSTPTTAIFEFPEIASTLAAIFVTEVTRSTRLMTPAADVTLEVCVDRGRIRAGERTEPISEIELEVKSGSALDAIEFARKLVDAAPVTLENRSKAERGYTLAAGEAYVPSGARAPGLLPDATVRAGFKAMLAATLTQLQANERGTVAGRDPEFLHQMRVALRRMRSVLRIFAPVLPVDTFDRIVAEVRWLARALGPARDWDVFFAETLRPVRDEFAHHPGFAELERRCERARSQAGRRARRALASRRYRHLVLDLAGVLVSDAWMQLMTEKQAAAGAGQARRFAAEILEARYLRVRRRGRKAETLSAPRLHRLRIAVKRLRYATDGFAGLFEPEAAAKLVKRLARLQDILGAINDAATAGQLLEACTGSPRTQALLEARGIVRGWSHARAELQRTRLRPEWKDFRALDRFW